MYEQDNNYLAHYGVLGMKWGVRHNPQRAYEKATKKFDRLTAKSDKALDKSGKHRYKGERKAALGMGKSGRARHARLAGKNKRKSMNTAKKAAQWIKSMEKEFSNQSVVSIDPDYIARGKDMMERYRLLRVI